jgi:hypothetical protein
MDSNQIIKEECEKWARFLYHLWTTDKELVNRVLEKKTEQETNLSTSSTPIDKM